MRIQDYRVCVAAHPEEFETMVKSAIKEGWQPFGDLNYTGASYAQAVVRFAELGHPVQPITVTSGGASH
jgi:hypothetical protein